MIAGAYTAAGMRHSENQDNYYMRYGENGGVFIVADGMGGHAAGDVASSTLIKSIKETLESYGENDIKQAVSIANDAVYEKAVSKKEYAGMGSTLVMCCIEGKKALIAHIGDSRAYVIEKGKIIFITTDHSYVQQLIASGELSENEAKTHQFKNIITRAVGVQKDTEPDITQINISEDSFILLCSDGVSNVLDDEYIAQTVMENDPAQAAEKLCRDAKEAGSTDDLTAIVINVGKRAC